jgi:hypothetical protein
LTEPAHDKDEVPEPPERLVGFNVHERFVELVTTLSAMVPEKLLIGAAVMVEGPVAPTLSVTIVGLAVRVKSWIRNVAVVVCESDATVPVTVRV